MKRLLLLVAVVAWAGTPAAQGVIDIAVGQDAQTIIAASPSPSTFRFLAGTHRDQNDYFVIDPRTGDTFTGEAGAIISGAKVLSGAATCGDDWCYGGQTQEEVDNFPGECDAEHPRCNRPEVLWIDDVVQQHVATAGEVVPGAWFFDYAADTIHIGTDPAGHVVETTARTMWFTNPFSGADTVTITGLRITKFGNLAQFGAIHANGGAAGWVISGNEVDRNHGCGIRADAGWTVLGNDVHHNGQLGLCGSGTGITISGNTVADNNTEGFDPGWEAGGMKLSQTTNAIISHNYVHHNVGPGLWTDIDNTGTLYEYNRAEYNCAPGAATPGIFHEISYAAIIRYNRIIGNGGCYAVYGWGAGILVAASPDVAVYGNWLEGNADGIVAVQQARGSGGDGPYEVTNLDVHDNFVRVLHDGWSGLLQDIGDDTYFSGHNNHFTDNTYDLPASGFPAFTWNNQELTFSGWQAAGQDADGTALATPRSQVLPQRGR